MAGDFGKVWTKAVDNYPKLYNKKIKKMENSEERK